MLRTAKICLSIIHNSKKYNVTLRTPEGEITIEVGEDEYILDAISRRSDVDSPSMCLQGWCLRCAAKIIEGEVDQSSAKRFFDADEEADFVLICSAKPRSDLVIKTHQKEQMVEHRIQHKLPAPRG